MSRLSNVLTRADRLGRSLLDDPVEVAIDLRERAAERAENRAKRGRGGGFMPWPPCPYAEHDDSEAALHELIGMPWPCPHTDVFRELWPQVIEPLTSAGMNLGRGAFAGWGDGEPGFTRAVWCLTRHLRPARVVETGVARGITSRFVLEAMDANGDGRLWSVDLPPRSRPELHAQIAAAVPASLRSRWSYVKGSSRRRLPALLSSLGTIDLFIHDSHHSERNLMFELERARAAVRDGGFLAADDIDMNCGMHRYQTKHAEDTVLVCPAEPLMPDPGRQHDRGVFALVAKRPPGRRLP
ncbi:MAG: class I SAM-dependent methyltransferase [Solirubrobacteraceae bacterium]